jgi:hypothetical protein
MGGGRRVASWQARADKEWLHEGMPWPSSLSTAHDEAAQLNLGVVSLMGISHNPQTGRQSRQLLGRIALNTLRR